MANIGFAVNTEELPDAQDFSPVPAGVYTGMIVNAELKPTNATKDQMPDGAVYSEYLKTNPKAAGFLALEIDLLDNGAEGRKIFHNLNLINDNETAVNIALGQLKQLLESVGMKTWGGEDSELLNKRFKVDVAVETGKPYVKNGQQVEGRVQNKVKKFLPASGGSTVTAPPSSHQAAQATGTASAPWKR